MATGLVIHISSGKDKHTQVLTDEKVRIGSGDDCAVRLRSTTLPKGGGNGAVLELAHRNGSYLVTNFDQSLDLTLNGRALEADAEITDGDELRIGDSHLLLTFYPISSLPALVGTSAHEAHVAPFIEQAALESAATARRDDAKVFLREFTRELVKEINTSTKLITLAIAVALVGGTLYIGFSMFKELQRTRRLIDDQKAQLAQAKDQASKMNQTLTDIGRSNKEIRDSLSLAVKLRSDFGSGICLIAGTYYFVESSTGRPLRYPESQTNEGGAAIQNSGDPTTLTPDGNAAVAEIQFSGTGFYVGDGFVITNRHIAQPWIADDRAQSLNSSVKGQPRLKKLSAYFPDHAQPIPLKFKVAGNRDDLAVCSLDIKDLPNDIPVIPLESDQDAVAVGKTVVMMGFPSGIDRLLALLDDAESRSIQQRYGGSLDSLLGHLAESRRIQPLTTQGNITDVTSRRIAYDARTAEGGSGAPVFGPTGRVIGVNFAVFTENEASNFAVPIRFGVTILERVGWKFPVEKDKEPESVSTPPK
ncbi:MAG TPA: trypsin-like peptidase domain-containing protein [Pyrinomonadaceae bacterium]|nr:trypsin-like peptidase domain-containing protein [Pyrinomonadaceae bacterium]